MPKKKPKQPITPQETLERFVIRARRVQAHSLVQDGTVERYARPQTKISMSQETESVTIEEHVIANEEALESLTTRLRPFIVTSEPIYLSKVLKAIRACVPTESLTREEGIEKELRSAEDWFKHRYQNKDSKAYSIQLLDENENAQSELSDAELAEDWVYTDTVHADPNEEKAEGIKYGYLRRYTAASSYFCEFAQVIVDLLSAVEAIADKGLLHLPDRAWTEPVTYEQAKKDDGEKVVEGSLYVFPVGTELPAGGSLADLPNAVKATPMVLGLLSDPEGRAVLAVLGEDDKPVASYPAYRMLRGDSFVFLINDVLRLSVPQAVFAEQPSDSFQFAPVRGKEGEAFTLMSYMAAPHTAELYFQYDEHLRKLKIKLEKNSGEKDETVENDQQEPQPHTA